ncbi:MAG: hypothetical protein WD768_10695 [Phycisphaeraceae bacterium]
MTTHRLTALITCIVATLLLSASPAFAADPPMYRKVALKSAPAHLIIPAGAPKAANKLNLLVHFKGGADALAKSFLDAKLDGVLLVIHWNGLSKIYSKPFIDNPNLLEEILDEARNAARKEGVLTADGDWDKLRTSCFSAGWASIRELLKDKKWFDRIDTILAADSIYAGFVNDDATKRQVSPDNMKDFRRFAELAAEGKKTFIVTHSQEKTPSYASTRECAEDLIQHLKLKREEADEMRKDGTHITSRAGKGSFQVIGCAGVGESGHMLHLTRISQWWALLAAGAPSR